MTITNFQYPEIIKAVIATRPIILKYFQKDFEVTNKKDDSPVTKADLEVNAYLNEVINKLHHGSAIISEENSSKLNLENLNSEKVFIIDPIDGTSSFIKGSKEFSVNIALKIGADLAMGIIYSPIDDVIYIAENDKLSKIESASADFKLSQILPRQIKNEGPLKVIATRRSEELMAIKKELQKKDVAFELIGFASSLKFCYLTEGMADCYYRMVSIKLWDVAAGFAIVKAAGFKIITRDGDDLLKLIFSEKGLLQMQESNFNIPQFIVER